MISDLVHRTTLNISSDSGVSNVFVNRFTRLICGSNFKGVYSADYIPDRLTIFPRFIIIVNLGERRGVRGVLPVGHFVTIVASPDKILYIDPFGLPPLQRHVNRFLKNCRRKVFSNDKRIQHPESIMCGLFAAMFASYNDQNKPFIMRFSETRLKNNDKLCLSYLRKLI